MPALQQLFDLEPLLARMAAAPPTIEQIPPDSPLFRFLL